MANSNSVHVQLEHLVFPMLVAGISTPLLGMVDTAVVGHLNDTYYLGAVALGAMIFSFLFWGVGFLRMSSTALTARAVGQNDQIQVIVVLLRGLLLAIVIGLLLISFQNLISLLVFNIVKSSERVLSFTKEYFDIRIWSAPASLANYVLLGWFLGQQKVRINLLLVVTGNLINIVLDLLFVVVFHWNVKGVAWATLLAEYFVFLLGIGIAYNYGKFDVLATLPRVFHIKAIVQYLKFNRDIFLRTFFLLLCFSFFTATSARYGELVLAANTVLMNLQTIMAYMLDSIAHAVEALVGKNYFREKQKYLETVLRASLLWASSFALVFSVFYFFFGKWIISLLTSMDKVISLAMIYLVWLVISPVISVWSYWFDGVYIGANQAKYMRNTMFLSMMVFFTLYFALRFWGNNGLWAALMGFMLTRGLSMAYVFKDKQLLYPRV